jgi:hypothetical protein
MSTTEMNSTTPLSERLLCTTLTGIDQRVQIDTLYEISRHYPFVEFGVLYSTSQAGTGRYPSLEWIELVANTLRRTPGPRAALHVCGRAVADLIEGRGHVSQLVHAFGRIQLNFAAKRYSTEDIRSLLKRHPNTVFITQYAHDKADLWKDLLDLSNHAVLFDASCGQGITPAQWPAPLDAVTEGLTALSRNPVCGYAGGLGPDNLAQHLPAIAKVSADLPIWLDMESKLRLDDKFDLTTALKCLYIVERAMHEMAPTSARTESTTEV